MQLRTYRWGLHGIAPRRARASSALVALVALGWSALGCGPPTYADYMRSGQEALGRRGRTPEALEAYRTAMASVPERSPEWEQALVGLCRAEADVAYAKISAYASPSRSRNRPVRRPIHHYVGYECLLRHRASMSVHKQLFGETTTADVLLGAMPPYDAEHQAKVLRAYADTLSGAEQQEVLTSFPREHGACVHLMSGPDRERWAMRCVQGTAAGVLPRKHLVDLKSTLTDLGMRCEKAAGLDDVAAACRDEARQLLEHVTVLSVERDLVAHCAWMKKLRGAIVEPSAVETCLQPVVERRLKALDTRVAALETTQEGAWLGAWKSLNDFCKGQLPDVATRCEQARGRYAARAEELGRKAAQAAAAASAETKAREATYAKRYQELAANMSRYPHAAHVFARLAHALGGAPAPRAALEPDDGGAVRVAFHAVPKGCEPLANAFGWRPGAPSASRAPDGSRGSAADATLTYCRFSYPYRAVKTEKTTIRGATRQVDFLDWKGDRIKGTERDADTVIENKIRADVLTVDVMISGRVSVRGAGGPVLHKLAISETPVVPENSEKNEQAIAIGVDLFRRKIGDDPTARQRRAAPLLQKARAAERAGNDAEALEHYERHRRAGGGSTEVRRLLEKSYGVPPDHASRLFLGKN